MSPLAHITPHSYNNPNRPKLKPAVPKINTPSMSSFLDVRTVIAILTVWNVVIVISFAALGFTDSTFFSFGPNSTALFFRMHVDTWPKWLFVVFYTVINQFLQSYGLETITPWMINKVQNDTPLSTSPATTYNILILWTLYLWIGRVFGIQLLTSQIDFLLFVLLSDIIAICITTRLYLREKSAFGRIVPSIVNDR